MVNVAGATVGSTTVRLKLQLVPPAVSGTFVLPLAAGVPEPASTIASGPVVVKVPEFENVIPFVTGEVILYAPSAVTLILIVTVFVVGSSATPFVYVPDGVAPIHPPGEPFNVNAPRVVATVTETVQPLAP